jgi:hypothetical protein
MEITDDQSDPLPVTPAMIKALQRTDPRCNNPMSREDTEVVEQVKELLKTLK